MPQSKRQAKTYLNCYFSRFVLNRYDPRCAGRRFFASLRCPNTTLSSESSSSDTPCHRQLKRHRTSSTLKGNAVNDFFVGKLGLSVAKLAESFGDNLFASESLCDFRYQIHSRRCLIWPPRGCGRLGCRLAGSHRSLSQQLRQVHHLTTWPGSRCRPC